MLLKVDILNWNFVSVMKYLIFKLIEMSIFFYYVVNKEYIYNEFLVYFVLINRR